jgi:phosphatidylethanolamine/phosphatidyl-N-methylethanolamine N-methyltransferase
MVVEKVSHTLSRITSEGPSPNRGVRVAGDFAIFFGLWLQNPLRIAAVNPSGAHLADTVARFVDLTRPGPVLELGAGTGSLTRGLIRAGCPPQRIIAFEREPRLAAVLRRDFPAMEVIEDDATRIGDYLRTRTNRLCAAISSLPIKWFSTQQQQAVVHPCLDRLGPDGAFLQMTNAFASPLAVDQLGLAGREIARVWRNLLPTQLWSYARRPEPPSGR